MRKFVALGLSLSLFLGFAVDASAASIAKAGAKCSKAGITTVVSGKKFTCIKSKKGLVWNSGVRVVAQPPKPQVFSDRCESDQLVPSEWATVQEWSLMYAHCSRALRYVPGVPPTDKVLVELSIGAPLDVSICKLDDEAPRPWRWAKFGNPHNQYRPTKSAVTQVIPFQFLDLKASSSPQDDYGKYIKFYEDYLRNSSDVPIKPEFRLPNKYFQIGKSYKEYKLLEARMQDPKFIFDISAAVRGQLDLTGVDYVLFLYPPSARYADFGAKGDFGDVRGSIFEGKNLYLQGPIDAGPRVNGTWSLDPWPTVHELFGHTMGLDDTFGGQLFGGPGEHYMPSDPRDAGMGEWGNMSAIGGDFLVWDKWMVDWVADSQIKCLSSSKISSVLISPNTTQSNLTKAVVLPISGSRGLVIESQRSTGYNFKFPKSTNGALVYIVEMKEMAAGSGMPWGYGEYVQRPKSRPQNVIQNGFAYGDAALKAGESITVEGIKVSVLQAGDFGDVVQIEPAK